MEKPPTPTLTRVNTLPLSVMTGLTILSFIITPLILMAGMFNDTGDEVVSIVVYILLSLSGALGVAYSIVGMHTIKKSTVFPSSKTLLHSGYIVYLVTILTIPAAYLIGVIGASFNLSFFVALAYSLLFSVLPIATLVVLANTISFIRLQNKINTQLVS